MMRIGVQIINKPAYPIAGTPAVKQMFPRRRYERGNTKPNTVPYGQTCSFACAINNFNLAVFLNDLAIYNIGRTSYDINGFYYPRLVIWRWWCSLQSGRLWFRRRWFLYQSHISQRTSQHNDQNNENNISKSFLIVHICKFIS